MLTLVQKSEGILYALTESLGLKAHLTKVLAWSAYVLFGVLIGKTGLQAQTFQETLGIASEDVAEQIIQTSNGGYVVVGSRDVFGNDDDIVLTRLDANGVEQWTRRYYGPLDEIGYDVKEIDRNGDGTLDGYAIVGTNKSSGSGDIYLILTDYNGVRLASKTYGGSGSEDGFSIVQMADHGYLLCGKTSSYGRPYSGATNIIPGNVFVVRTDINLTPLWSTVISSDELTPDYGYSAIETLAGDIMLTGTLGGAGYGGKDIAVIKLDQNGAWQWSDLYGSPNDDAGYEIREVIDQGVSTGFVVAATVEGLGTGGSDAALLRLDVNGNYLWHKLYGGTNDDAAFSVAFTPTGGFALCGTTNSFGFGSSDVYVVETDPNGVYLNSFTYGGTEFDEGRSIRATSGPGYIICGNTDSFGAGMLDEYIIKTNSAFYVSCNYQAVNSSDSPGPSDMSSTPPWAIIHMACTGEVDLNDAVNLTENVLCDDCTCNPQPSGYQHAYGTYGVDRAHNIIEVINNELLIVGRSNSYNNFNDDAYVVKTDAGGNLIWAQTVWPDSMNTTDDHAVAAVEMPSGDNFIAGTTDDGTDMEVFVFQLDAGGALTGPSYTFNPTPGTTDAWAVDAQPIFHSSGNVAGILVLAALTGYNTGQDAYLLGFDNSGNFGGGFILDQTTVTSFIPHALTPIDKDQDGIKDDGWLIVGTVNDASLKGTVVIELDAGLTPTWHNLYQPATANNYVYGYDIMQIDSDNDGKQDDEYAITGSVDVNGNNVETFIALLDQSGAVVGGGVTQYAFSSVDLDAYAITQTCDNDLVVTGSMNATWQMRTDVALNVSCATGYGSDGLGEELLQTSDGGIAIVGMEYNSSNSSYDAYLVKTDCDCSSGCNEFLLNLSMSKDGLNDAVFAISDVVENSSNTPNPSQSGVLDETTICIAPMLVLPEESTPVNEYMPMDSPLDNIEPSNSDSATDVDDETLNGAMLEIYPNPVQNGTQLNVTFNSRTSAQVSVKVTNVLGAVIGEYPLNASPGEQSLQLDTQDWTPGTYTLTLNSSACAASGSIVVVVR